MSPWNGPRHRSWASNTVLTIIAFVIILAAVMVSDYLGDVPVYLVGLLGTASGALFAALGSDKEKKDAEVKHTAERAEATADRAENKADALGAVTAAKHPEVTPAITPPFEPETLATGGDD